tara:strand:+ start:26544 stop:27998 length:1455 start_codon:yes stop_codon:yes gene_type:complete
MSEKKRVGILGRVKRAAIAFGTGWENADSSPRRRTPPGAKPRDWKHDMTQTARSELVRRSRYLQKNSGFYEESGGDMALYAVGTGIRPQSMAEVESARKEYEDYWKAWSENCDVTGRFSMDDIGNLASRAVDFDGEIFTIRTRDLRGTAKLQIMETHRLSSRTDPDARVYQGIRLSAFGKPLEYYFLRDDKEEFGLLSYFVSHIFEPRWSSALRNPPTLQHGFNNLLDSMELLSLEKHGVKDLLDVARVLKSNRESALDDGDFQIGTDADGDIPANPPSDPAALAKSIGGRIVRINENESLDGFDLKGRPSPTFQGFLEYLLRDTAGGGLPYEVLRDPSKVGGAVVRLLVSKTDRRVEHRKQMLIRRLYKPTWFYVIGDAIDKGELPAVPGWWKTKWTGQRRITVDAGRDEQQSRLDLETGRKSWEQDFAERGMDFEEDLEIRKRNARAIMTAAGHPETEPIPLWMLYKPSGTAPDINMKDEDE